MTVIRVGQRGRPPLVRQLRRGRRRDNWSVRSAGSKDGDGTETGDRRGVGAPLRSRAQRPRQRSCAIAEPRDGSSEVSSTSRGGGQRRRLSTLSGPGGARGVAAPGARQDSREGYTDVGCVSASFAAPRAPALRLRSSCCPFAGIAASLRSGGTVVPRETAIGMLYTVSAMAWALALFAVAVGSHHVRKTHRRARRCR
jgi:hypothetical protein